ncbi:MbnP family protein [Flavobacterium soli]|uniref:MbnP family protein n=1 Tax=Flavobacterium soli TaxID=344881 RepID=UPI00040ECC5B|nr:MbnP family protein [Flavobacterium soli]
MKTNFKHLALFLAFTVLLTSCSNDDSANEGSANGTFGEVELFFDNGVNGDALVLGSSYTNSNGETLTINRFNYIVSNIVLIKEDGTEFTYPKNESYFLISEETEALTVHLENVPSGNYKQIKFGIGVDQQRYLEGETAQQEFWNLASANNMVWTWSTGYRFINFEGTFTSLNNQEPLNFQIHQGSNSATDNYRQITLNLPSTARVRTNEMPNIHLVADANVIADGTNKIILHNNLNNAGTNASIMGGENLIKIATNTLNMFKVDHVHNGAGSHH